MLENTDLGTDQKRIVNTSSQCQRQLSKILDDSDLDNIIDGYDFSKYIVLLFMFNFLEFTWREILKHKTKYKDSF
jgi:hypothetical protein